MHLFIVKMEDPIMSKKAKKICLSVSFFAAFAMLVSFVGANAGQFAFASLMNGNRSQWVHYNRLEPTEEHKGIREYWVQCGGSYQFTEPESDNIIEGLEYDTSEFTVDDDRWIPNEIDCDAAYWYGKKWVALGTSITSTRDTNNDGVITGKYPNTLVELSGLVQTNYGVEGANLGGHPLLYSLLQTYKSNFVNADLITIEGGINDWYAGRPLGTLNDVMPYYNNWTPSGINLVTGHQIGTFAGSCYSLFSHLKNLNPTATIVALTDCSGPDGGVCAADRANSRGLYLSDYNDMMESVAEAVGIHFIDVGGECGITGQDSQYFSDHVHLNDDGGEIYASYIWNVLQTYTKKIHDSRPTVTVTFKTNNETVNTQTFERGGNAYAPYPGTYGNRDFLGFDASLKNITTDTVINTIWSAEKYTITFNTDGGSSISSITDFAGSTIGEITPPTKSGYIFDGWDKEIPSVMPSNDLTITALWREEDNLFSRLDETKGKMLMMDGNTGSPYEYAQSGHNLSDYISVGGRKLIIEFDVDTLRNASSYSQAAFNITPFYNTEGGAPHYSIYFESYSAQNDYMTVTRVDNHYTITWVGYNYIRIAYEKANVHNISVKYGTYLLTFLDGETIISSQAVVCGEPISAPATPTKEGYTFDGWSDTVPATMPNHDLTLSVVWREADNLFSKMAETKGKMLMMDNNGYPYEYNHSGRNLSDYIPVNGKKLTIEFDVDTVRNAQQYSQAAFNITPFNDTQGSAPQYSIFYESYSASSSRISITRVDNHYTISWNGYNYVRIAYEKDNLHNLSIKYTTYSVTFSDGENIISSQRVVYGEAAVGPTAPTKEGYIFNGWDRAFNNVTSDLVITAKWRDENELFDETAVLANTFINSTVNGTANGYKTSNYFACNYKDKLRIDITRKGSSMGDFRIALGASNNNSYLGAWQSGSSSTLFDADGVYDGAHLKIVRETDGSHTYFTVTNKNNTMHYVRISYQTSVVSAISVKAVD